MIAVAVGVAVAEAVAVGVRLAVGVDVVVRVGVLVAVAVELAVAVRVGVDDGVAVGVRVDVGVEVAVAVDVGVGGVCPQSTSGPCQSGTPARQAWKAGSSGSHRLVAVKWPLHRWPRLVMLAGSGPLTGLCST